MENPSTYLGFAESTFAEVEFISEMASRTGCDLLLDVNNVHVRCTNDNDDAAAYLAAFPLQYVVEVHLAGHTSHVDAARQPLLIDSHDRPVDDCVWALFRSVVARMGPVPTLIERDASIPEWQTLLDEALRAHTYMEAAAWGGDIGIAC